MVSTTESIMEIMAMILKNNQIKQNSQKDQEKRKRRGKIFFVPLLLVISMIAAGCNNTDQKSTEAVTLVAEPLESESMSGQEPELTAPTESESSSGEQGNAVETPGGLVEVISIESGEPSLEPEDILPEGYEDESSEISTEVTEPSSEEASVEDTTETPDPTPEPSPAPVVNPAPPSNDPESRVIDFATLQATKNADIYAWINVPGTNIDYPVLQHPTDNGYYLYHNLNHSQGYPGCIYTENFNSKNWTDPVTVLYGHDMRSTNSMFHQLHKFEKQSFFDQYEYFYIYTPDGTKKYRIFSAFVNSNEHLLGSHNFYNKDEFDAFFGTVLGTNNTVSHVRDGVSIDSNSKIVALSTCIKNQPNNRYIIFGVLVN